MLDIRYSDLLKAAKEARTESVDDDDGREVRESSRCTVTFRRLRLSVLQAAAVSMCMLEAAHKHLITFSDVGKLSLCHLLHVRMTLWFPFAVG